jgi:prefoldin subunit 5
LALTVLLGSGFVAFEELADALKHFGKKIKDSEKIHLRH